MSEPQADGQCQSVPEVSAEDRRFPLLRWMLDVRAALARGNVPRRVLSLQPKPSMSRAKLKRKWSEQALLGAPRDKKTRKLMQRAERRAQQASSPSQAPRRKGGHPRKTVRGAAVLVPAKARSLSSKQRGSHRVKPATVDVAAGSKASKQKGRKLAEQRIRQGKDARTLRSPAKPASSRGRAGVGAGKQHAGWSAD